MTDLFTPEQVADWQARLLLPPEVDPPPARQPVHVVYGGAHRFTPDIRSKLGRLALASLDAYAPSARGFAETLGLGDLTDEICQKIFERVRGKLERDPVDDYRIDFEDGYGARANDEEDAHARAAADALQAGVEQGTLPPLIGVRLKSFEGPTAPRALRTLRILLERLPTPPDPFLITMPKVERLESVAVATEILEAAEAARGWPAGRLQLEVMVESPRLWFDGEGRFALPSLVDVARGRLAAAHLGPYDYTASVGVAGADQSLFHPVLDVARHLMQVGLVGAGIRLGDGPTMLMPIAPHRPTADHPLSAEQRDENRQVVHAAWRSHADAVRASTLRGFDVGWDLHPAQIPARLGAVYAHYHQQLPDVARRLKNFIEAAGQATRVGSVFDDAATGQGLVNFCLRAMATGALDEQEIVEATGLTADLLRTRSFAAIVDAVAR